MTWGPIDLFIIYMIGIVMVTILALVSDLIAKAVMKPGAGGQGKEPSDK